jgi:hypothetical protein
MTNSLLVLNSLLLLQNFTILLTFGQTKNTLLNNNHMTVYNAYHVTFFLYITW